MMGILEDFLNYDEPSSNSQKTGNKSENSQKTGNKSDKKITFGQATTKLSEDICNQLIQLPDIYAEYDMRVSVCEEELGKSNVAVAEGFAIKCELDGNLETCLKRVLGDVEDGHLQYYAEFQNMEEEAAIAGAVEALKQCLEDPDEDKIYTPKNEGCAAAREIMLIAGLGPLELGQCVFKAIDKSSVDPNRHIACTTGGNCINFRETRIQLDRLQSVLEVIEIEPAEKRSATIGKATGIGAAVGAGAGGIATAITALVESDNINCRVGDGLGQVGLNKSYSIDGLKDLYVKWNLNLQDTQVLGASGAVTDEATWKDACDDYVAKKNCEEAQFYYKNASGALEWIYSACTWDTATYTCNPNNTLLKSYGVIE